MNKQKKIVLRNPFDLQSLKTRLKNKKILVAVVLFAFILLALGAYVIYSLSNNNGDKNKVVAIDRAKITELTKAKNCPTSISELKDVQANEQDIDGSIALLGYRATCYYVLERYPDALQDYRTLKYYFDKKLDARGSGETASLILSLEDRIANPKPKDAGPKTQDADQMTSEFKEELKNSGAGDFR